VSKYLSKLNSFICAPDFLNQLWTIISIGTFTVFPSLLVFIVTRQVGLVYAGMLVYAFALADLPSVLAMFGVRALQNVDIKQEYKFSVYLWQRTICTILATVGFIAFLILADFGLLQLTVVLLVFIICLTNAYADVFLGELQQKGMMRVAGKMKTSALAAALAVASIVLIISNSLVISLIVASIVVIAGYILWIWAYRKNFGDIRVKIDVSAIKKLTMAVLPILVTEFLMVYVGNAQKYYLEAYVSIEIVAIFSFMMLPISLLYLACVGLFQGAIVTKTARILESDSRRFKQRVNRQLLAAIGLPVPCLIFVYFFGPQILSWIYATQLLPYRPQLMLLFFGATTRIPVFVLGPVLVILRKQKQVLYGSIVIALTVGPLMWYLVSNYGLQGAAYSNIIILFPQSVMYYVMYRIALHKREIGMG